jgi:hypothetical protein
VRAVGVEDALALSKADAESLDMPIREFAIFCGRMNQSAAPFVIGPLLDAATLHLQSGGSNKRSVLIALHNASRAKNPMNGRAFNQAVSSAIWAGEAQYRSDPAYCADNAARFAAQAAVTAVFESGDSHRWGEVSDAARKAQSEKLIQLVS